MINLKDKNKKCECGKVIPSFGIPGKKPTCCKLCKKDGMVNAINEICPCGKSAVFGFKDDKKPTYCAKCKKEDMENIVTKKCKCGKAVPCFGVKGSKPTYCKECKTEDMVNVVAKACKCGKAQPIFGLKTDKRPSCCVGCKTEGMVNIANKMCSCGKSQPTFGNKGDKVASCCVKCKKEGMVNIKAKMCKCGSAQPVFGLPTDKKPSCCTSCKDDGMVDIMSNRCKGLINYEGKGDLKCPYDYRAKLKYSYYCTKCFEHNFPNDPRTALIRSRVDENKVRDYLAEHYPEFIHDKALWTDQKDCTCRRRIDFRTLIDNTLLCIEVDENQHKYYDSDYEEIRYDEIMLTQGSKMIFIRINPHLYIDADGNRKNPEMSTRLKLLDTTIMEQVARIHAEDNEDLLEVVELFFDE